MEFVSEAQSLMELIATLEHATLMAKSATDPTDPSEICSSFQKAHHHLGAFLGRFHQTSQPLLAGGNSVSYAVGEDEPMQVGDDEVEAEGEVEGDSRSIVNKVEERMRDFALKNKRRKRPLSPFSVVAADQCPSYDKGSVRESPSFDPQETSLRSLDLVFQFHG